MFPPAFCKPFLHHSIAVSTACRYETISTCAPLVCISLAYSSILAEASWSSHWAPHWSQTIAGTSRTTSKPVFKSAVNVIVPSSIDPPHSGQMSSGAVVSDFTCLSFWFWNRTRNVSHPENKLWLYELSAFADWRLQPHELPVPRFLPSIKVTGGDKNRDRIQLHRNLSGNQLLIQAIYLYATSAQQHASAIGFDLLWRLLWSYSG